MDITGFKTLLTEFVSYKSISTDKNFAVEIQKTVWFLKQLLSNSGFKVELWQGPASNQVVFGSYELSADAPTVLVYGHYDVQPASQEDGWKGDPFTVVER